MQVKIQSLLKSILAMSLILQTTGCVFNVPDTPSIAQEDTSSLPSATSNAENIEGKWSFEYTSQEENQAITNKSTVEYFPGDRFNSEGELSISGNHEGRNLTLNYSYFATGSWSIKNDSLIETTHDVKSSIQSIIVDGKPVSSEDVPPEVLKEIPSIESQIPKGVTEKSRIISSSPSEIKLEVSESGRNNSVVTYRRVEASP
ncbi:hypothetical protein RIVM261_041250 [Rivularia sp. IAM M-261]|nr:hypothetical protein RIVM261_041250 [Rivularia sp. IAM M-261]